MTQFQQYETVCTVFQNVPPCKWTAKRNEYMFISSAADLCEDWESARSPGPRCCPAFRPGPPQGRPCPGRSGAGPAGSSPAREPPPPSPLSPPVCPAPAGQKRLITRRSPKKCDTALGLQRIEGPLRWFATKHNRTLARPNSQGQDSSCRWKVHVRQALTWVAAFLNFNSLCISHQLNPTQSQSSVMWAAACSRLGCHSNNASGIAVLYWKSHWEVSVRGWGAHGLGPAPEWPWRRWSRSPRSRSADRSPLRLPSAPSLCMSAAPQLP